MVVPTFANDLNERYSSETQHALSLNSVQLVEEVHDTGINIRHLGRLRALVTVPALRALILTEMLYALTFIFLLFFSKFTFLFLYQKGPEHVPKYWRASGD